MLRKDAPTECAGPTVVQQSENRCKFVALTSDTKSGSHILTTIVT